MVNLATLNSVAVLKESGPHLARVSHVGADEGRSRSAKAGALAGGRVMRDEYDLGSRGA